MRRRCHTKLQNKHNIPSEPQTKTWQQMRVRNQHTIDLKDVRIVKHKCTKQCKNKCASESFVLRPHNQWFQAKQQCDQLWKNPCDRTHFLQTRSTEIASNKHKYNGYRITHPLAQIPVSQTYQIANVNFDYCTKKKTQCCVCFVFVFAMMREGRWLCACVCWRHAKWRNCSEIRFRIAIVDGRIPAKHRFVSIVSS